MQVKQIINLNCWVLQHSIWLIENVAANNNLTIYIILFVRIREQ